MNAPKPTRAVRARVIRDHLLLLMQGKGFFVPCSNRPDVRSLQCSIGPFLMSLHTPFTPMRGSAPVTRAYEEAVVWQSLPKRTILPYSLDVWRGNKVMSVQWSDTDEFNVISFRSGPWEAEALALTG